MNRLLLIDGHAYAYRAFHAIRSLRSPAGRPVNALFGFIKMLGKLRSKVFSLPSQVGTGAPGRETLDFRPETLVAKRMTLVVWDGGLSAERMAALPGYKAQRPEMPADLAEQMDQLVEYLRAAGVASFCQEGAEADDYIAGFARRAARAGAEVVVASSDKDFMQLVSDDKSEVQSLKSKVAGTLDFRPETLGSSPGRIGLFNPNDKSEAVWSAEQVRVKSGVEPGQIVDWLALVGDSVDNIPGVPGVGTKTAADLLRQFGSVANLYQRLGEVKSERVRQALADSAAVVRRNVELVRLKDDLPCALELDDLLERPAEVDGLRELFGRWGFRSMLAELESSRQEVLL